MCSGKLWSFNKLNLQLDTATVALRDGYDPVASILSRHGAALHVSCLEMMDADNLASYLGSPQGLLQQVQGLLINNASLASAASATLSCFFSDHFSCNSSGIPSEPSDSIAAFAFSQDLSANFPADPNSFGGDPTHRLSGVPSHIGFSSEQPAQECVSTGSITGAPYAHRCLSGQNSGERS
ncbi:hypothetical protein ACFX2G_030899 [Malus domestica]